MEDLGDLEYTDDFLDLTLNTWSMKEKMNKLDITKTKNLCSVKDYTKRIRRQTIN